ncbi:hypothetical protein I6A60_04015 [Frankia sp. AgB1.9]|uniref:hypothetical protein n=1 Tax=unclassified Frankia TaxID=2632575 RepID=UPI0019311AA0|nr:MULTISPECIES: hypothetical protein [unclassified Frankia]MBL7491370.1 hypothetical protein [Frankia sp. AgW1.1]MBL7547049.1 hypothetical protein [Frankia sp. AgB1.9]MBL7621641.1 hypothetical protein [Frankia sp. AgB1.8]
MNLTSRATRRLVTTSALAATLAGGVVLPATAASAATPAPTASTAARAPLPAPIPIDPQAPTPAPAEPRQLTGTPPRADVPQLTSVPGQADGRTPAAVEPRGGVDTGLGGTQRNPGHSADLVVPVAAGAAAGLGALGMFGLRRRRVSARG